jgi:hypothetical protein
MGLFAENRLGHMAGVSNFFRRSFFQYLFQLVCNNAELFNRVIHWKKVPQLTHFLRNASDSVGVGF